MNNVLIQHSKIIHNLYVKIVIKIVNPVMAHMIQIACNAIPIYFFIISLVMKQENVLFKHTKMKIPKNA